MKPKKTSILGPVLALTALDQGIKVWITSRCPGASVTLLSGRLRFQPVVNRALSWVGQFIPWLREKKAAIGLNLAALAIIWHKWRQICRRTGGRPSRLSRAGASLSLSAGFCSLLDKSLWGGSLDYLQIPDIGTLDLKDTYLFAGLLAFLPQFFRREPKKRGWLR